MGYWHNQGGFPLSKWGVETYLNMFNHNNTMENVSIQTQNPKSVHKTYYDVRQTLNQYFVNRTPLITIAEKPFAITDVVSAAILSKTNMYFVGTRGSGKTLLSEAIYKGVFNENGFFFRGDVNLRLKDLYIKLNLDGKNEDEIYQAAKSIGFPFVLIDEMNRVPGLLQNSFLPVLDGSIEIRGRKYNLGTGPYLLMAGTGNPAQNGNYTGVFDEDLALLDRIPLIINTDAIPLAAGDAFDISYRSADKRLITNSDLGERVISTYSSICDKMRDEEVALTLSLLTEFTYRAFRYVQTTNGSVDKLEDARWRDKLSGEHAGGLMNPFCSEISMRTLLSAEKMGFAMYEIAREEQELKEKAGIPSGQPTMDDFTKAYFGALKLALTSDRRFVPEDLSNSFNKPTGEIQETAMNEVRERLGSNGLENAVIVISEFVDEQKKGASNSVQNILSDLRSAPTELGQSLSRLLENRLLNEAQEKELETLSKLEQ